MTEERINPAPQPMAGRPDTSGVPGEIKLEGVPGDIELEGVPGEIELEGVPGDIVQAGIPGTIDTSGNINMTNEEITQALQYLIGSRYVPAARGYISELTGRARVHGPRDITSREYDVNRITVQADAGDIITGFSFG